MTRPIKRQRRAHLHRLFGTASRIADIAIVDRGAVTRWLTGQHQIAPDYQIKLLKAGIKEGMDKDELAHAIGVQRCPHCGSAVEPRIEQLLR